MSNRNSNADGAPLVMELLRDRCNVQHDSLKSWHLRARLILGAVMSLGALLAVADLSPGEELVRVLVPVGLLLIAFVVTAETLACRWQFGPDTDSLALCVIDDLNTRDVEIELVTMLASQIQENEKVLGRVMFTVAIELAVGTAGVFWLLTQLV